VALDVAKKDHTIMTQSNSRLFDDLGRLMTDAAGLADGVRREVETVARSQMERMVATMDLAREEDIDVLRDMIAKQRRPTRRWKRAWLPWKPKLRLCLAGNLLTRQPISGHSVRRSGSVIHTTDRSCSRILRRCTAPQRLLWGAGGLLLTYS
jgi:BMFP domain-containing protein YqiC